MTVINGARSIYWWQGQVEESAECVLLIKSSRERLPELGEELQRVHSYQVPEVVALPIVDGLQAYLDWLDREIQLR